MPRGVPHKTEGERVAALHKAKRDWYRRNRSHSSEYSKAWYRRNTNRIINKQQTRRHRVKVFGIKHLGGSCIKCNLNYDGKNACVFQFHHRDPDTKDSAVDFRTMEALMLEIDKCDLLCANCHFMHHSKEY
jgi:hypothetical protein